jgi:hypothetical protein
MFDLVWSEVPHDCERDLHITAAACLYICSKQFDLKYLHVDIYIQAIALSKIGFLRDKSIIVSKQSFLDIEFQIFKGLNFSVSNNSLITPLDFFNIYFFFLEIYFKNYDIRVPGYEVAKYKMFG